MNRDLDYLPEAQAIAKDYPGWHAWSSLVGKQWHARLKGAQPVVMLHDNSPAELRRQIEEYVQKNALPSGGRAAE
jgi:hypothetical protein